MLSILCSMKVNAIAHASDFYQCTMPKFCRHTILLKLLSFQVETFSQQIQFIHSPVLTYSKVMCAKTHVHFITPTKLHAYGFIKGSLKFFGSINVVMLILFTVHCTSAPLMLKSLKVFMPIVYTLSTKCTHMLFYFAFILYFCAVCFIIT